MGGRGSGYGQTKHTTPELTRARAASEKIASVIPDLPEAKLYYAVINLALLDLCSLQHKDGASRYLQEKGFIHHCDLIGIDPVWAKEQIVKNGVVSNDFFNN